MASPTLRFWFDFASSYSYLTAMRIETLCGERRIALDWKPFLLGPIFQAQGLTTSPFNVFPAKGRYMWRDMQRQCAKYGLPLRRPSVFPRTGLKAARLCCAYSYAPWLGDFIRGVFHANFAEDAEIAEDAVLAAVLERIGQPAASLERASDPAVKAALKQRTEQARALDIFGAPTFLVAGDLYWGNDRLEDALDYAVRIRG